MEQECQSAENVAETIGEAAARYSEEAEENVRDYNLDESDFEDPDPPASHASREEKKLYHDRVESYSRTVLEAFEACPSFTGEVLWIEFTRTFRSSTIKAMPPELVIRWSHLLRQGGINMPGRRGTSRVKTLIHLLESDTFPEDAQSLPHSRRTSIDTKTSCTSNSDRRSL